METTTLILLVMVPLMVWRIYARLKKLMTRTQSTPWQHWLMAVAFSLLLLAVAVGTLGNQLALSCLGAGALAGAWLGVWGIKLTRFENTTKGFFYTPHRRLGLAVIMLLVARVMYRGLELYINSRAPTPVPLPNQQFMESPLTLLTFGMLAAYYAAYGWGLVRWRRSQKPLPTAPDPLGIDKY